MSVQDGTVTSKKKSLFGNIGKSIGSVFYDDVPGTENDSAQAPSVQSAPAPVQTYASAPIYTPGVDAATRERLQTALQENGLPNTYDYLKFKSSVNDLATDIADERLRYKTVFSTV